MLLSNLLLLLPVYAALAKSLNERVLRPIIEEPSCSQLIKYCDSNAINQDRLSDIETLECVQRLSPGQLVNLTTECQHIIWEHGKELITNEHVYNILSPHCQKDLSQLNCRQTEDSFYFKCIVDNKENIHGDDCFKTVDRLENVVFQDFRLLPTFLQECEEDIKKLKCGRIDTYSASQTQTVVCLQMNIQNITKSCRREVLSLAEIQANNIKMDHELYAACKEDHLRYCSQFIAGGGRVFQCLMQQEQAKLSSLCIANLFRRQKLISQDYKISKGLMRACREDIRRTHCRKQTSNDKTIRLAQILLCLEGVVKNGSKVDHDCEKEMLEHRKLLMADYRLSPEIVNDCKLEIKTLCFGIEIGGKTIHCLMENARVAKHNKRKFSDSCIRAVSTINFNIEGGDKFNDQHYYIY